MKLSSTKVENHILGTNASFSCYFISIFYNTKRKKQQMLLCRISNLAEIEAPREWQSATAFLKWKKMYNYLHEKKKQFEKSSSSCSIGIVNTK